MTEPTSGRVQPAVEIRDLSRWFGMRAILAGVDLRIGPGEVVAMLGASGAGKSTLLRILAGLDRDYDGTVVAPSERAVVFQEPNLLPWARVLPNVVIGLRGSDAAAAGRAALGEVGLGSHERAWPSTLSGGEAQRVALARALVRRPQLLLLDEPFGALDALTRIKMRALLARLLASHRPATLLVTHDVDEAILLADRVTVLGGGRITVQESVTEARPRDPRSPHFAELRTRLLMALGVDDTELQRD